MKRDRRVARSVAALAACAMVACATAADTAQTAAGVDVALLNAGFESAVRAPNGDPQGWLSYQHAGPVSYAFTIDEAVRRSGKRSLRIANVGPEPFGSIVQNIGDPALRGRTVRFSGWLRTQDVAGNRLGGGAVLLVLAKRNGSPIAHDRMRGAGVMGTTDWRRYEITFAVPERADELEVGATLFGAGTRWFDDAALEIAR